MELKSDKEYLEKIAKRVEGLVENLKEIIFKYRIDDGIRGAINNAEAKRITGLITGKLEGININGNELILDDIITIYDNAIKAIDDELARNEKIEEGDLDKFNKATIDSFKMVRKVLEDSKARNAGPLKIALDELVDEKSKGAIDQEYNEIKVEEIEVEESSIQEEINDNTEGLNKFELATRKEREALEATLKLSKEYFNIKKEIDEIDKKLKNPDLSDEQKKDLEDKKAEKEKELVSVFKKFDEKYEKDDKYKQKEKETDRDYLDRIAKQDGKSIDMQVKYYVTLKQGDLKSKIKTLKGQTVKIYNEQTKKFEDIDIEKYIDVNKGKELNNLSSKIVSDKLLNREGVKEQRNRLNELKRQKERYTEQKNYADYNNQTLPIKLPKKIPFKIRKEHYRDSGYGRIKSFFKALDKKSNAEILKVYAEYIQEESKNNSVSKDVRKQFLIYLEEGAKKGLGKDAMKRHAKAELFKDMDNANREDIER